MLGLWRAEAGGPSLTRCRGGDRAPACLVIGGGWKAGIARVLGGDGRGLPGGGRRAHAGAEMAPVFPMPAEVLGVEAAVLL